MRFATLLGVRLALVLLLLACRRPVEVHRDPTPAPSPSPSPAPTSVIPKEDHRTHGDVDGKFRMPASAVVGEPIVVTFEARALAPLTVFVGGDMRNVANYPLRFGVRAIDASGAVVCDLVAKPTFMSFGGMGGDRALAKGEVFLERFVLNPACPALATPGEYRVTLHRRFTNMGMVIKKADVGVPMSCDLVPIHEDPLPPSVEPACAKLLADAPSVTSTLSLRVTPFDRAAIAAAISALPPDEILRHRVERHVCSFLTCSCPKAPVSTADLIAALKTAPAKTFPSWCP